MSIPRVIDCRARFFGVAQTARDVFDSYLLGVGAKQSPRPTIGGRNGREALRAMRQRREIRCRMPFEGPGRQQLAKRFVAAAVTALSMLGVIAVAPAGAGLLDPLNPFRTTTNGGTISPEERARREQARNELYDRLSPGYRMSVPFVSDASATALQRGIEQYQRIMAAGGWPTVPAGTTLRLGDTGAEIVAIRRQLAITGDLSSDRMSPTFDDEFQDGLARFQIRNGLRVSGFVDSRTLAALNVSAPERLKQLETNLARVKSLMTINKAPRYVLVNVPAYTLQAIDHGNLALDSNVVVGKPARATPAVSARIVEVNFYPTWTVPDTVAQQDLIPKLRKDPSYFTDEHFSVMRDWKAPPLDPARVDWNSSEVVSYKFVQDPGTFNALGVVRINMPNKYSVYMHDTPLKQLFSQSARAFSSGCVRVEKVLDLVAWLLGPQSWTPEKVQAAAANGQRINVTLTNSVPVHFVYLTAFVSDNGVVQFRPDIYGRDAPSADEPDDQGAVVAEQRRAVTP
jgi:murein L,D-transpeptidase YcbB/YkuD